eukprot:m.94521 g.94521  ORF g.94521 m.94521 type:complete len:404 (+) comp16546_c0_seq1:274-1485(+)
MASRYNMDGPTGMQSTEEAKTGGVMGKGVRAQAQVVIQKLMGPDDANIAGNVHGGEIMKLIESAGYIAATRHLATDATQNGKIFAALARLEHMDFVRPMHIGNLAQVSALVTYTSRSSLEVNVTVWSEDCIRNTTTVTNRARLWYVAVETPQLTTRAAISAHASGDGTRNKYVVCACPKLVLAEDEEAAGRQRYLSQKQARSAAALAHAESTTDADGSEAVPIDTGTEEHATKKARTFTTDNSSGNGGSMEHTPLAACGELMHLMLPSDCTVSGIVYGGVLMKLMDNAAGISAFRYCKTNVVTAAINDVDFHERICVGDLVIVRAIPVFTSRKSMEIHVTVHAESIATRTTVLAASARLTFVSLNEEGKCNPIPMLQPQTVGQRQRFDAAHAEYTARKQKQGI